MSCSRTQRSDASEARTRGPSVSIQALKVGWCLLTGSTEPFESEILNDSDDLLNDTPTSSPFPLVEMSISSACHFSVVTP